MKNQVSITLMLAGILFSSCLLISNIISSKIIMIGLWAVPAGVLIFPLSYIINDVITEVWGFRKARLVIWTGFAMNLLAVLFYSLSAVWPAAPFWQNQEAFATVLGSTPRIAAASLAAYLAGSFINAVVMSKFKLLTRGKSFSLRAILSTLLGESADSAIFITVAFAGFIPARQLLIMVAMQAAVKTIFEIVLLPATILIVRYIKKVEQTDTFDVDVSYNPFKIGQI
ncbi:MAG TPA: queuosine precursor transporter [Prolixibacteraceae bacterium]|nr:queuosine precursor transporter [Prolixibacteraceae bacterium]